MQRESFCTRPAGETASSFTQRFHFRYALSVIFYPAGSLEMSTVLIRDGKSHAVLNVLNKVATLRIEHDVHLLLRFRLLLTVVGQALLIAEHIHCAVGIVAFLLGCI